ncbi:hypothetical protein [Sphingobacterium lactis]|uniref:Uncharacterized protein n=1 Tax=Sphingobacterium lactis TaxID=797291 RepID=A0A1H6CS13_9SPHI|nr:hypothetical protein [Sphingobacterium lactis]SEG75744.1 hypothetical protein SAMN05421877_11941 [Sphingobacterium lactis]
MNEQKQDMIDRKVDGVVKIFGLARQEILALVAVFFMGTTGWLLYLYISTYKDLNNRIVEEVRKQVPTEVSERVNEQVPAVVDSKLEGVKEGVDKALNKVDTIVQRIGGK